MFPASGQWSGNGLLTMTHGPKTGGRRLPKLKITQRAVDAAKAADKPKVRFMDIELQGFGIRVLKDTTNGPGRKEYIVRYTDPNGKETEVAIGDARKIPCEQARQQAKAALGEAVKGADLLADRKVRRAADQDRREKTLQWVVNQYRKMRDEADRKRPQTVATEDQRLDSLVLPKLGTKPVRDIKAPDVTTFLEEIEAERTAIRATHARAVLGLVLSYALRKGWVDYNAAKATEVPVKIGARKRLLSDAELRAVWNCGDSTAGTALRVAQLTLTRSGETSKMEWANVDLKSGIWTIPPEHTKKGREHVVPLSAPVVTILEAVYKKRDPKLPWVFPNNDKDGPIDRHRITRHAHRTLEKMDPDAPKFGPHDLRRTATTRLGPKGFANFESVMARVLSHESNAGSESMSHYLHYDFLAEKRQFLEAWAEELQRVVETKTPAL